MSDSMRGRSGTQKRRAGERRRRRQGVYTPADWVGFALVVLIMMGAVLFRGYVYDDPVRGGAWCLCALFGVWAVSSWYRGAWNASDSAPALWIIALMLLMAILGGLHLVPIPSPWATALSPVWRGIRDSMQSIGLELPARVPLATGVDSGLRSLNQLVASTAFFAGACAVASRRLGSLLLVLMVAGLSLFEGILGLGLFAFGGLSRSAGIIYNPNHHAAAVIMGLPLAATLVLGLRRSHWSRSTSDHTVRDRIVLLSVLVLVAALGWLISFSRGSLVCGLGALTVWWVIELRADWRVHSRGEHNSFIHWLESLPKLPLLLPLTGILLLLCTSFFPGIGARLSEQRHLQGRTDIWLATFQGLRESNYLGMGPGGAEHAINRFTTTQPTRYAPVWSHNDYVQVIAELGLPFLVLAAILIVGFVRSWLKMQRGLARRYDWHERLLRRAGLVGALITLMHAAFDFHLRIPLIGFQFLLLAAVLCNRRGGKLIAADSTEEDEAEPSPAP